MAVDCLLKITGLDGESRIKGHEKEIDVLAWSWGMTQSGSMHIGGGGGSGKVSVQDISLTKYVDKASPTLIKYCCNGKHFTEALLTVRKAGENPVDYLKIKMKEVIIASVSTGGSAGEDRLTENVTLNFAKFEVNYTPQKDDGTPEAAVDMTWNIKANAES